MVIADRLRALREEKKLSQGDIEKRTGLFRCYISRVENGYTVPAIETIEKFARALKVPLYQLFYDGEEPPKLPAPRDARPRTPQLGGIRAKDARVLNQFPQASRSNGRRGQEAPLLDGSKDGIASHNRQIGRM